eukprot:TRINITY_DN16409_c0_g3_i1.p1 TRINITY_DN16409_c0_g3~~TRINITY_DN16409_c0_g3_i1.p1  ORF type:complete len:674 (-),score=105.15 TRINITY_DN16409_c0_g3_i1:230-2251(-)
MWDTRFLVLWLALAVSLIGSADAREFKIQNDVFMKDGQPFTLRSGDLHYFRIPPAYWRDRIQRMKALGLNCVTTYVAWNFHEEVEGKPRFDGWADLVKFLDIIHEEGMLVLLRPGPYMCAEWEMGGLPAWLLMKEGLRLRTYESQYIAAVDRWWGALLPRVHGHLYSEGGPIVMVQIENEYGSFGNCSKNPNDVKYMHHLLDLATQHLGTNVIYSTVQGAGDLAAGSPWKGDPRVFATVDGPLDYQYLDSWKMQKAFNAKGNSPRMWTELWDGWFTAWGHEAANKTSIEDGGGIAAMVKEGASFSLYMAHGGTNFGFWSGANSQTTEGSDVPMYMPDITSYDYNAPISEAGDHNIGADGGDIFHAIKVAIASRFGTPQFAEPPPIKKVAYGRVSLPESAGFFDNLDALTSCRHEVDPGKVLPSMEQLGQMYGMILYQRALDLDNPFDARMYNFSEDTLHDRVQVFVDRHEAAVAYRPACPAQTMIPTGSQMDILVENMGRTNFGERIYDYKGLLTMPIVPGTWSARCIPLEAAQVQALPFKVSPAQVRGPKFRRGVLQIEGPPHDTFLDTKGLMKGYVWVNGFNIGRYWETAGPQHGLYVPAPLLRQGANEIIVFELHEAAAAASILSTNVQRWIPDSFADAVALGAALSGITERELKLEREQHPPPIQNFYT